MIECVMAPDRTLKEYRPKWIDPKYTWTTTTRNCIADLPDDLDQNIPMLDGRFGYLHVKGGRRVTLRGGSAARGHIRVDGNTGDIAIMNHQSDLRGMPEQDSIAVAPAKPVDVLLQDLVLHGAQGGYNTLHTDIFQGQADIGTLMVNRVTAHFWYQCFMLKGVPGRAVKAAYFDNLTMVDEDGDGKAIWLGDTRSFPVFFGPNVFLRPFPGRRLDYCFNWSPQLAADGQSVSWDPALGIFGSVRLLP